MNKIHKTINALFIIGFVFLIFILVSGSIVIDEDKNEHNEHSIINSGVSLNKENTLSVEKWSGFTDSKNHNIAKKPKETPTDIVDEEPIEIIPKEKPNYTIRQESYNI